MTDPKPVHNKQTSLSRNWKRFNAFYRRFARNRGSLVGLGMLLAIFILGWVVPLVAHVNALKMIGDAFLPPSAIFYCGTDDVGRNVFHQIVVGAQTSVMVGLFAAAFSTIIGLIVGSISGYYGQWLDAFLMRGTELFMVIPRGFLALVLVAIMGASIWNIIFAIGVLSWPSTARLVRSEFLKLKHSEFVDASRASGAAEGRIIVYEILPNALPTLIVNTALEVGSAILLEAGISFLGLGDPGQMSWGIMLFQAQIFMRRAPWMTIFPGVCIFMTVMGLNLFADGLNEAVNPKFRRLVKLKAED